ncbi:hypothetical protein GUITHDRAFT_107481 [Guillardia theta CCMP2712]|uniref:Uncharacterized protein n=2 Tax=Guillardia theta TaxID=55529 RepID=L1JDT7_GUITC|nr:hypothetical protein GUITHDRAFT_107481 [Guillardia theta CCMP2712]EKX46703.1 hypothetical protein GUITHDRAFT_107481 [Guillardia theta CCMP2712]|eukprot:XP_005833683.1 hypothetical protein GUITHDRAFT_107481 [Guillardia theta CCMP2712]
MSKSASRSVHSKEAALQPDFLDRQLGNSELIKRLKVATEVLEAYGDEDEIVEQAKREIGQLSSSLGEDWLVEHKNKDVRLLVACALADVLRIYAPDPPYEEQICADIMKLFIKILRDFENPDMNTQHPSYSIHFYLLERLSTISIFSIIPELIGFRDELMLELTKAAYTLVGNMPNHSSASKVTEHLTSILCSVIEETEYHEIQLLDLVVGALCQHEKKENPNEAVYELSTVAPRVLTQVLPAYTEDLTMEDPSLRIKAVKLLGAIFSVGTFQLDFSQVFTEFKRRTFDKDPDVRKSMASVIHHLVSKRPELSKAFMEESWVANGDERDAPMRLLVIDSDEGVRCESVSAVFDLSLSNPETIPTEFLKYVSERVMDKKASVRKKALEGLANLWQKYCAPYKYFDLTNASEQRYAWIPSKILSISTLDQESRVHALHCLENICLNEENIGRPSHDLALDFFCLLDHKGKDQMFNLLRSKHLFLENFLKFSQLQTKSSMEIDEDENDKTEESLISKISSSFADPSAASEAIMKLRDIKTGKIWENLEVMAKQSKTAEEFKKLHDDVMKKLGPRNPVSGFMKTLLSKLIDNHFGITFIQNVLKCLQHDDSDMVLRAKKGLPVLAVQAKIFATMFSNEEAILESLLMKSPTEDPEILEYLLKITSETGKDLHRLRKNKSFLSKLENYCSHDSWMVAKYAIRSLLSLKESFSADGKKFVDNCVKALNFGPGLPSTLRVLVEVLKVHPELSPSIETTIEKFVVKKLLHAPSNHSSSKKDRNIHMQARVQGIKLISIYLSHGDLETEVAETLLDHIQNIIQEQGEVSTDRSTAKPDRATLRLVAGSCLIKIAKSMLDLFPPQAFLTLSRLLNDEDSKVKSTILKKLYKGTAKQQGKLPFYYASMFAMVANDTDSNVVDQGKSYLRNVVLLMNRLKTHTGKANLSILPERILPWLIFMLVLHEEYTNPEVESTTASMCFKKCLEFYLSAISQLPADDQNTSAILQIFEYVRKCSIPMDLAGDVPGSILTRNVGLITEVGQRLLIKIGLNRKHGTKGFAGSLQRLVDSKIFREGDQAVPNDSYGVDYTLQSRKANPKKRISSSKDDTVKESDDETSEPFDMSSPQTKRNRKSAGSTKNLSVDDEAPDPEDDVPEQVKYASSSRQIAVGAVVEAEMKNPHTGKLEWLKGKIIKVNAKKKTFDLHFEVTSSDEQGDWTETYKFGEEGKEWRWPLETPSQPRGGLQTRDRLTPAQSPDKRVKASEDNIEETAKKIAVGAMVEAEMENPHTGKLEWLKGKIIKVNAKKKTFDLHFEVTSSDEQGDWTETYKFGEEGKEWRWPAKHLHAPPSPEKSSPSVPMKKAPSRLSGATPPVKSPASSVKSPASSVKSPASSVKSPASSFKSPASGVKAELKTTKSSSLSSAHSSKQSDKKARSDSKPSTPRISAPFDIDDDEDDGDALPFSKKETPVKLSPNPASSRSKAMTPVKGRASASHDLSGTAWDKAINRLKNTKAMDDRDSGSKRLNADATGVDYGQVAHLVYHAILNSLRSVQNEQSDEVENVVVAMKPASSSSPSSLQSANSMAEKAHVRLKGSQERSEQKENSHPNQVQKVSKCGKVKSSSILALCDAARDVETNLSASLEGNAKDGENASQDFFLPDLLSRLEEEAPRSQLLEMAEIFLKDQEQQGEAPAPCQANKKRVHQRKENHAGVSQTSERRSSQEKEQDLSCPAQEGGAGDQLNSSKNTSISTIPDTSLPVDLSHMRSLRSCGRNASAESSMEANESSRNSAEKSEEAAGKRKKNPPGLQKNASLQMLLIRIVATVLPFGYGRVRWGWEEVAQRFNHEKSTHAKFSQAKNVSGQLCREVWLRILSSWQAGEALELEEYPDVDPKEWDRCISEIEQVLKPQKCKKSSNSDKGVKEHEREEEDKDMEDAAESHKLKKLRSDEHGDHQVEPGAKKVKTSHPPSPPGLGSPQRSHGGDSKDQVEESFATEGDTTITTHGATSPRSPAIDVSPISLAYERGNLTSQNPYSLLAQRNHARAGETPESIPASSSRHASTSDRRERREGGVTAELLALEQEKFAFYKKVEEEKLEIMRKEAESRMALEREMQHKVLERFGEMLKTLQQSLTPRSL